MWAVAITAWRVEETVCRCGGWWNFGYHKMREISWLDRELLAYDGRPFSVEWRHRRHVTSSVIRIPAGVLLQPLRILAFPSHCAWSRREARDAKSVSTASWYGFVARPLQSVLADEKSLLVDTDNKYCRFRHVTWPLVSLSPLLNTVTFMSVCSFCYRRYSKLAPDIP